MVTPALKLLGTALTILGIAAIRKYKQIQEEVDWDLVGIEESEFPYYPPKTVTCPGGVCDTHVLDECEDCEEIRNLGKIGIGSGPEFWALPGDPISIFKVGEFWAHLDHYAKRYPKSPWQYKGQDYYPDEERGPGTILLAIDFWMVLEPDLTRNEAEERALKGNFPWTI